MIKFGAITIDTSHPLGFAQALYENPRGKYTAVYNDGFRGEAEVKDCSERFGLKICRSVRELAEAVDIGMIHACNWDRHLSYIEPFAELGKPVFIDKPIVGSMADCRRLRELEKNGVRIIGTSSLRYCDEVMNVKNTLRERNSRALHIDVSVGCAEFNYAIHAVEEICAIADSKPISAKYIGTAHSDVEHCDSYMIFFENGTTACYHNYGKKFCLFNTIVLTTEPGSKNDFCFSVDNSKLYASMLERICDYLEGKESGLATVDEMIDSVKVALACKASRENGGIEVSLSSDMLEGTTYDGYSFEARYAASAKKMYL